MMMALRHDDVRIADSERVDGGDWFCWKVLSSNSNESEDNTLRADKSREWNEWANLGRKTTKNRCDGDDGEAWIRT